VTRGTAGLVLVAFVVVGILAGIAIATGMVAALK